MNRASRKHWLSGGGVGSADAESAQKRFAVAAVAAEDEAEAERMQEAPGGAVEEAGAASAATLRAVLASASTAAAAAAVDWRAVPRCEVVERAVQVSRGPLVVVTGGALGADCEWVAAAAAGGVSSVVISFVGHRLAPALARASPLVVCLAESDVHALGRAVAETQRLLGRPCRSGSPYVRSLLARNVAIARAADTLLAVGMLVPRAPAPGEWGANLGVAGGTAYACEVFARCAAAATVAPGSAAASEDGAPLPLYFFEQGRRVWLQARCRAPGARSPAPVFGWRVLASTPLVRCEGVLGAVGTRELSDAGRAAVWLFFHSFDSPPGDGDEAGDVDDAAAARSPRSSSPVL